MKSKQKSTTMRRTLLMIMAVALLLTQCRKPEVKFPTPSSAEGVTVSMTVTAGPGGKTDISETGGITWSTGDKIYVGYNGKYVGYLTLQSGFGTATGTFTGSVTLPDGTNGEKTFHFFYLGSNAPASLTPGESTQTTVSFASQTGLRGGLGSCHVGHGSAKDTVTDGVVTGINVTLVSKVALARFSFKKSGTPASPYEGALTLSGANIYNSMKVNFGGTFAGNTQGDISLAEGHSDRYVMLVPPANVAEEKLTFGGAYEGNTTLANGIEANKFYGRGAAIVVNLTKVPVSVTGVNLNKTNLSLAAGATETLTATVTPETADNKNVTWSSSNESVATVSDGLVTAVAEGTATITVTTVDGNKTATCTVTVTAPTHEYVDLGLSVKWAKCNLGASKPEEYGDYYRWGGVTSVTTDINVGWDGCPHTNGIYNSINNKAVFTKYVPKDNPEYWAGGGNPDNKLVLESSDDAATVAWGSGWRMPTEAEFAELINNTNRSWITENDVAGWKCANKSDATKYIFLPAAGCRRGPGLDDAGSDGYYWSSSLVTSSPNSGRNLNFDSSDFNMSNSNRYNVYTVRPVCPTKN